LVRYEYDKVVDAIAAARQNMPADRPLHLFGAGHPMMFPFAVALGVGGGPQRGGG
jgi:7-cyano-7-deazaguanine tRNA-ribosyltransferase